MNRIRRRATKQLPSVLLTLLSIIQAIALESLWDRTIHRPEFFEASWIATLGWLQVTVTFSLIVLIWVVYIALLMRFRWTPALTDLVLPFAVGIAQFALIELTHPARLGEWCLGLAVLAVIAVTIDFRFIRRARHDPRNKEFFDNVAPATWRDHAPQVCFVLFAFGAGVFLAMTRHSGWFAFLTLMISLVAVAYNSWLQVHFWNRSMGSAVSIGDE